jgi:hypothetical protein
MRELFNLARVLNFGFQLYADRAPGRHHGDPASAATWRAGSARDFSPTT